MQCSFLSFASGRFLVSPIVDAMARDVHADALATTTTSTWVPLLIAALGVLATLTGVIFTQLWNSRLETRRWEREHNRQRAVDSRDDRNRTYEHRREAYVDFLRDLERLRRAYTDGVHPPNPAHATFDALWDLWTAVMIYGTPEAQSLVQECGDAFGMLQSSWGTDAGDSIIEEIMDSWHQLLSQVRKDLGVSDLPLGKGNTRTLRVIQTTAAARARYEGQNRYLVDTLGQAETARDLKTISRSRGASGWEPRWEPHG